MRAALALLLLSGCSLMLEPEPVPGWPRLETTVHMVPTAEMRDVCATGSPWLNLGMVDACAVIRLDKRTCDVWLNADLPPPGYVVDHEFGHCEGRDHWGSTQLRDLLKNYEGARR